MPLSLPEVTHEYEREVRRVTDRLRGLAGPRMHEAGSAGRTRAEACRSTAQRLADTAAELEADGAEPVRRALPDVADSALCDVLTVMSTDLQRAAALHAPDAAAALEAALQDLVALRRDL